jgi:hypothetical protein
MSFRGDMSPNVRQLDPVTAPAKAAAVVDARTVVVALDEAGPSSVSWFELVDGPLRSCNSAGGLKDPKDPSPPHDGPCS